MTNLEKTRVSFIKDHQASDDLADYLEWSNLPSDVREDLEFLESLNI